MDLKSQMPFIEAAVKHMKKYRDRTRDVSSFGGVWDIDGHPEARGYNYACHALMDDFDKGAGFEYRTIDGPLRMMPGVKPRLVWNWSKGGKTFDDPVFKRFTGWLASEKSPYRTLWKRTPEGGIWVHGEDVTSDDFCTKFGFIIPDLDVPANLLVNFFIMSRQYDEHRQYIQTWDHLVQAGAEPNLAMFFGHHLNAVPKGNWVIGRYAGPAHAALDSWLHSSRARVENFCRGQVKAPSKLYSVDENYRPCNTVWGDSPDFTYYPESPDSYRSFVTKTYSGLFGLGGGPRAFAVNVRNDLTITTDNLVRLINTEAERIDSL